jgi:hypothetical protein
MIFNFTDAVKLENLAYKNTYFSANARAMALMQINLNLL